MRLLMNQSQNRFRAVLDGRTLREGCLKDLVPYIAKMRSEGLEVECDSPTHEQRCFVENQVEIFPLGFRLKYNLDIPGRYLPFVFETECDAIRYQCDVLRDSAASAYTVVEANWRSLLL